MKRVGASAHRLLDFLSLRNAQMIKLTTAWAAVSSPSESTRYSFLQLSGVRLDLWANIGDVSAQ